MNVGQQSLIRGSGRMTLLRLGLPLSSWRALEAHSASEGSPALFRSQRRILRRGCSISFCFGLLPLAVNLSRRFRRGLNHAGDRPDEAHHLARDSNYDDVGGFAARRKLAVAGAQPDLRFPGDVANWFW